MSGVATVLVATAVTLVVVWPLRALAIRLGILDNPDRRKSHRKPVPYLGGVAVLIGMATALLVFHPQFWRQLLILVVVTAVGLYDDIKRASVSLKLGVQGLVAVAAIALGYVWQLTDSPAMNAGISLLWIVGLTNSFNLLDNMDGLAATIAATSLLSLALIVPLTAPLALPLAGGLIGFLFVNRPPARMYLGDAGSLMIGCAVALSTIAAANTERGLHSFVLLTFPVAVALLDTSLVIVSRVATGRPVQLGGRDHFSHRLLRLGWSGYQILLAALAGSAASGLLAFLATRYPRNEAYVAIPIAAIYVLVWLRLLGVDPYSAEVTASKEVERVR